jgi:pimeloyl-ACP methyl ester carboxylesterase
MPTLRASATTLLAALSLTLSPALGSGAAAAPARSALPAAASAAVSSPDALPSPFYAAPATLPAAPGQLVKSQPATTGQAFTRLMYTTTNAAGRIVPVTGMFFSSTAAWTGPGARPLVSYAPGTRGVANACAASVGGFGSGSNDSTFISSMLAKGYNVVVTDYLGLGMAGFHTYMNRVDQGHALLDAARVARSAGLGGTTTATPVGLAGYSQGGGASASAAELAPSYTPDLKVTAAYAGAVPADLKQVVRKLDGSAYNAFLMYSTQGLLEAQGIDPRTIFNAFGMSVYRAVDSACVPGSVPLAAFVPSEAYTLTGTSLTSLSHREPFSSRLDAQKIGVGRAPRVPVLIAHSVLDDVIPYRTGVELARRWCAQGTRVTFEPNAGVGHVQGYAASIPGAMLFFGRQFSGTSTTNSCGIL